MILVTTAGKVGAHAARLLAERGQGVRVLVRDPTKGADLADRGVEVFQADLSDPAAVDAAMVGIDAVILVSPAVPEHEIGVIHSARHHQVAHVVKVTSDSSLDSPIARRRDQAQIEIALAESGLGYTLLKNNAYMQNFLMLAPSITSRSAFDSPTGEGRVAMIDTRDVAAVAAQIAAAPARHDGHTYWPTGPESLSYTDAAAIFTAVLGRQISVNAITLQQQFTAMLAAGVPRKVAQDNGKALGLFAAGELDYVTPDVQEISGRSPRSFKEFVRDHRGAFTSTTEKH